MVEVFLPMWTEIELIGYTYPISWALNGLCMLVYLLIKGINKTRRAPISHIREKE